MKVLGIDFGTKRIGIAISDENSKIAFPKEVIKNDLNTIKNIIDIIKDENVSSVVVGESVNQKGEENKISLMVEEFTSNLLKNIDIKIHKEKEFFSSFEAHFRMGKERNNDRKNKISKTNDLDAKAAQIILQRYLDRKNINN